MVFGHMGGWLVSPAAANNHTYFHQQESQVPYKCSAPPLFHLKLVIFFGAILSVVQIFCLIGALWSLVLIFYGTGAPCRDW